MKRLFFLFCFPLWICGHVSAQQIRPLEPDAQDAIAVLKAAGYEFFKFDFSDLKNKTYTIQIYLKEVDSSGVKPKIRFNMGETRQFLKDIPAEDRVHFTPIDPESGLFRLVSRLGLYIIPKNDSTMQAHFNLGNNGGTMTLKLRPLETDAKQYMYASRPFKLNEFKSGVDIPLVLYGSFWYDERIGGPRFCGVKEIDPDMSTEILQYIPHYYIIGIRLTETN